MMELMAQMGMSKERLEQMRQLIHANQQAMQEQINQFAGQRIAENMSEQRPDEGIDELMDRPFGALSDRDMDRLRREVASWPTACAAASPCARSGPRPANWTPRQPSAPTSNMVACPWRSNIATTGSSPSWS